MERRDCEEQGGEELLQLQLSGNLPSDILLDILSRLPLKSLSNFRWVCKSWFNAISHSPRFATIHYMTNSYKTSPCVLLRTPPCDLLWEREDNDFDLVDHQVFDNHQISTTSHKLNFQEFNQTFPQGTRYTLLGPVNGLLCFATRSSFRPSFLNHSYYVCNPITQEHAILPNSPRYLLYHDAAGFGFDSSSDKYKLIRILSQKGLGEAEVYTLGSGKWRIIKNVPHIMEDADESGVFVNGSLHWFSYGKLLNSFVIVSFNISTEEFHVIRLPPIDIHNSLLGVFEECLCISSNLISENCTEIWKMKNYGLQESWTKEYVFGTHVMRRNHVGGYQVVKLSSGELLFSGGQNGRLGYYEPSTKILWHIKIQNDATRSPRDNWEPMIFFGSLFSPKRIEGSRKRLRSEISLTSSRPKKVDQRRISEMVVPLEY